MKSAPLSPQAVITIRLRSKIVPRFTKPPGKVPLQVMMSSVPVLVNVPLTFKPAAPVRRSMPLLTRLLVVRVPGPLTVAVQPAAFSKRVATLSQPLVMLSVALF